MKKQLIKKTNEYLYYEKLDNGLEVFMVPKTSLNDFFVTFTTKYGGVYNDFVPSDKKKMTSFPSGIAHFLEHKMFEQEDHIDPFSFFSETGTYCNAMTNYYSTSYLFTGNSSFEQNLNYLLDFVQSPYFTNENVEKEKGIIEQEIKMYDDMPDRIIYEKILYNIFIKHPMKYSIAGKVSDIKKITKEDLYICYNTFYNPSNMFLVITGNFDPEEAINLIKENQLKKKFKPSKEIETKKCKEPDEVAREYEEKAMNIDTPYLSFGIKIPISSVKDIDEKKRNYYYAIILYYLFGETSLFNESITNEKLADSYLDIEIVDTDMHKVAILLCKSKRYSELIERIKENLKVINIDEEFIERRKKVFISSIVYSYENVESINRSISENVITYNNYDPNIYDIINSLNKKELDDIISKSKFDNTSIYIIKPLNNKE